MSSEVQGHTSVEENSGTNGKRERERADEVEGDRAMGKSRKVDTTAKIYGTRSSPSKTSLIEKALDNAFGPLKLDDLHVKETVGSSKTRNHANPLGVKFLIPLDPPSRTEWSKIYSDPTKPLFVDIGCAAGRFGIAAAKNEKLSSYNHLGFEIRKPLVLRANAWAKSLKLGNCHYVLGSANSSMESYLSTYPGDIQVVAVQFPDPHFKRKHQKRRVLQPEMLQSIASMLPVGGTLFLQSDVESIAAEMRDRALESESFKRVGGAFTPRDDSLQIGRSAKGMDTDLSGNALWTRTGKRALPGGKDYGDWPVSTTNPFGVPTEREVQNIALEEPIYRAMFERNDKPCPKNGTYTLMQTVKAGNVLVTACRGRSQGIMRLESQSATDSQGEKLQSLLPELKSIANLLTRVSASLPNIETVDAEAAIASANAVGKIAKSMKEIPRACSELKSQLTLLEDVLLHLAKPGQLNDSQES